MKKTLVAIAIVLAVGGLFFYMTTAHATQECQVCVQFNGRTRPPRAPIRRPAGRSPAA